LEFLLSLFISVHCWLKAFLLRRIFLKKAK